MLFLFTYSNTNHNEAITRQSLNIGKNQPKQTTEFQLTIYKGALHSKELFYTVYLQCNPFHSWFLRDLSQFCCCARVSALVTTMPRLR